MKLLIAGGGTGGHVYPAVAVYRALKARLPAVEVLFLGSRRGVEGSIFAADHLPHLLLPGFGLRGIGAVRMILAPFAFLASLLIAIKTMRTFNPDLVMGTGGFASATAVAAAILTGKPRVLQEQNSVPGMANRLMSRFAHLVLLAYEESKGQIHPRARCEVVGNPIRFSTHWEKKQAARDLGLDPALPTVLVFGGSRGARSLNTCALGMIEKVLEKRSVQFLVISGSSDFARVEASCAGKEPVKVLSYLPAMDKAYCAADVAVARAGASSVFELAYFGVPTIFVPYPHAADDHQRRNVEPLVEMGAAVAVDDRSLDGESMGKLVCTLLDDEGRRRSMAEKMKQWVKKDAAAKAAGLLCELMARGT